MAARLSRPRRRSRRATLLLLGVAVVAGLALLWVGPALADPSPAPGPAPAAPGAPTTEPGVPDPGSRPPALDPSPSVPARPAPIPQPTPTTSDPSGFDDDPAWYDVAGQTRKAVVDLIGWAAEQALQPVMAALGASWLSTPDLTGNDQVKAIWTTSLVTANGVFVLFIVAGGFLVSARETLQTRYGLKQVLPRLAVGGVLTNCSLILAGKAIEATNAITVAIAGNTVDGPTAATAIRQIVDDAMQGGGLMLGLLVIAVIVMCLVLEITFVLRLAALIVLIGVAPAALICHASPLTEGIAHTWWRAFAACLGLQLGQAIVVMATVKVFLTPTGPSLLGIPTTGNGLLAILVCLTMLWVLIKLPGWMRQFVLGPIGQRGGRGLIGQLVHAYLTIKTLGAATGLLRGAGAARAAGTAATAGRRGTTPRPSGPRRSPPRTGGPRPARSSSARSSPARPSPAGPAPFSHAPAPHTPLSSPSGTSGAPTFSPAPSPAGSPAPTGSPSPSGSVRAARFSHPSADEPGAASPAAPVARVAFSDAGPATARSASASPASAVTFSAAPTAHGAPRRPPAPVTPVFSSAPAGSSPVATRSAATPASRPTAGRRATPAARAAAGATTPASTPPTRTAPAPASRTTPAARATTPVLPPPAPAQRAPTPSRSGPPSPPTGTSGPSPATPAAPAVRAARPGSSPPPSSVPPSPAPPRSSGSRTSRRRGER